jgi:hypothetical protein
VARREARNIAACRVELGAERARLELEDAEVDQEPACACISAPGRGWVEGESARTIPVLREAGHVLCALNAPAEHGLQRLEQRVCRPASQLVERHEVGSLVRAACLRPEWALVSCRQNRERWHDLLERLTRPDIAERDTAERCPPTARRPDTRQTLDQRAPQRRDMECWWAGPRLEVGPQEVDEPARAPVRPEELRVRGERAGELPQQAGASREPDERVAVRDLQRARDGGLVDPREALRCALVSTPRRAAERRAARAPSTRYGCAPSPENSPSQNMRTLATPRPSLRVKRAPPPAPSSAYAQASPAPASRRTDTRKRSSRRRVTSASSVPAARQPSMSGWMRGRPASRCRQRPCGGIYALGVSARRGCVYRERVRSRRRCQSRAR